jgi:tetratricopeptide (TPR) repeat protein
LAFLHSFLPLTAFAESAEKQFEQANKLYEQGRYAEAASAYDQLISDGQVSAAILFNRGNAFFKAGEMGRAIASYRQAQRLSPRDPDLRANLKFARDQVNDEEAVVPLHLTWLRTLTVNEWTLLAATATSIWFLLLALTQWRPTLRAHTRLWRILIGLSALMFVALVCIRYLDEYSSPEAVVIVPETEVRHGPLEESKPSFTARDGMELRILDRKDEWLQVENSRRQAGWLRASDVLEVSPTS